VTDPSLEFLQRQNGELRKELEKFKVGGGGGGGTVDGMEARVARLEADVSHIQSDIGEIKSTLKSLDAHVSEARVTVATLTERIGHLPTKAYIGMWITGGITVAVGALTLLSRLGWLVAGSPTH
jgi:hypothetical protein